ncbi:MAG: phosphatidate cytidylyltransferase [SAR324 cluster bacterium]|nr:phosphatidate cytidylyltransferase [SAR324 cluster bacterium]
MLETEKSTTEKKHDLPIRVKTGIPAAVIILGIVLYAPAYVVGIIVLVFVIVGIFEFDNMFGDNQVRLSLIPILGGALLLSAGAVFGGIIGLTTALLLTCTGLFFHLLIIDSPPSIKDLQSLGICLFGVIWIPWSLNHITLIKNFQEGTSLLLLLIFIIWVSDIAAYFGGKTFGRIPLAPAISPKKTLEGSICGVVGAGVIAAGYCLLFVESMGAILGLLVGIFIAAIGQVGDLIESKIKRVCNVKDSGRIFPGHGGVLDRMDSFLTAAPFFCYLMYWINR